MGGGAGRAASDSRGEMREPPQTAPSATCLCSADLRQNEAAEVTDKSENESRGTAATATRTRGASSGTRARSNCRRGAMLVVAAKPLPTMRLKSNRNPVSVCSAVDTLQDIDSKLAALRDGREMDGGSFTDGGGTGRPATVDALLKQIRAQTARGESQADSGSGHCGDSRPVSGSETETGPMARDKSRLTYPLRPKHVRQKEPPSICDCWYLVFGLWIVMTLGGTGTTRIHEIPGVKLRCENVRLTDGIGHQTDLHATCYMLRVKSDY